MRNYGGGGCWLLYCFAVIMHLLKVLHCWSMHSCVLQVVPFSFTGRQDKKGVSQLVSVAPRRLK